MGRMLEAFKLLDPQRQEPKEDANEPTLAWPRPGATAVLQPPAAEEEEVPFIEVGGPRSTMEASPQVRAAGEKVSRQSSAAVSGPKLRPVALPRPADSPTRFMTVIFRPLPGEASPLGPAQRRFAPELIAFHRSEHPVSEQYRMLAEGITAQLPAARAQVLLFTSLEPEVGATTVLLNTAITFARQGRLKVAVVEANLSRPALARRLGLPEAPGLRDLLAGTVTLTDALHDTGQPNLLALPGGDGGLPRLLGDALRPVFRQLRERFDLVLVDAPCWDGRPEMVALGSACDLTYLVLSDAEADTPDAEAWVRTIPHQCARLRGCIVTQR
jgi:Mrp family chromosome partitioning ATPase